MSQVVAIGEPRTIAFDADEYQRRTANVQATMVERGLDGLLLVDPRNVFYLTGVESQGAGSLQCLIVPAGDGPTLVTWDFEKGGAELTSGLADIATYTWFEDPVQRLAAAVAERGLARGRLGIELRAHELSAGTYAEIRERLPNATFEDAYGIVEGRRITKSAAEIAYIREAAAITDLAVEAAYSMIAAGVRDTDVAAAICDAVYRAGSETVCWGPVVATGYRAGIMHTSFHGRTLLPGDTVFLELSGQIHHYVAPVMRTAVIGQPTREMVAFRDAGLACIDAILGTARAGVTAAEVSRAASAELEPIRDSLHFHGLYGYSVGIGFPPSWFETLGFDLRTDNERPLEEGMVFHVPISLRKYGEFGVNQSQTILIQRDGAEALTHTSAALYPVSV